MNQLRIVLGRHVIRQGDVSPDPLTYRPSDRPTYLMPLEPQVRPHPLTYLRGMTDLPEPVCAVRGQRVDPLEDLPEPPPASQRYPLTGPSDVPPC